MSYQDNLEKFRVDRNLTDSGDLISNVLEELVEVRKAGDESNLIEEVSDICVYCFNDLAFRGKEYNPVNWGGVCSVDALTAGIIQSIANSNSTLAIICDIETILNECRTFIEHKGYDFDKVMLETSKKILSRNGKLNKETKKWEKQLNQEKSTLYIPNHLGCKIK